MQRRGSRALARALILVAAIPVLSGCVHQVQRREWAPGEVASIDRKSPFLKAHGRDGTAFIFTRWDYDSVARVMSGDGVRLGVNRDTVARGALSVPLDSVALFESNVVSTHSAVMALAVITGLSAIVTIACLSNPKACFGSCPTFYA